MSLPLEHNGRLRHAPQIPKEIFTLASRSFEISIPQGDKFANSPKIAAIFKEGLHIEIFA